ncbi:hypothetical protein RJT34_20119 [Clitoria ternatea]|uniref:Uncharacterized protein n=1 Tax=Clitoria ternatea TaxID=43366 RepID=A0AAN9P4L6_CLITE
MVGVAVAMMNTCPITKASDSRSDAVILTSDDDQKPSPLSLSSSCIPFPVSFPSLLLPQTLSGIHGFRH